MRGAAVSVVILAVLALSRHAYADDPRLDYRTIETPHFWVHYHSGTEDLAWRTATLAEEAHEVLSPLLDWTPKGRTHVVVNDKVDTANGSATVFGRKQINVFGMPPEADSVLGFYDDWLRVLVYHEYVHILHLDTILGIPPVVNKLIGQQWVPSQTLPRWYIEGLATYYESAHTRGGRVDSSLFKMYLRTAALDDEFFNLGSASGPPVNWPMGTVAYLYGGFFLDYVFAKYSERTGSEFNRIYGRRVLPWGLNAVSRKVTGETFEELWQEWTAAQHGKAQAERLAVRARGETEVRHVTTTGGNSGFPRLRPGTSEVWFYEFDHETAPAYTSVLTTGAAKKREFEVEGGASAFAFSPDGEELIYTQSTVVRSTYRYLDLFVRNLERGTTRRMTTGERAREPAVSPDGRWLVYVRNQAGTMELVLRDYRHPSSGAKVLLGGTELEPSDPDHWQQISTPTWAPDSRRVAFSWWRQGDGQRDIWVVDTQSGKLTRLTNDFAVDMDPSWAADGRLFVASDRSGIYNIYELDPDSGEMSKLSNVVTGMFAPQLAADRQTMFTSYYGRSGFDVASFRLPNVAATAPPSVVDAIEPVEYPDVDTEQFVDKDYTPGRFMSPLLLQPELGVVSSGAGAGLSVQGFDPLSRHRYSVGGGYTTGREILDRSVNFSGVYGYTGLPVGVVLSGVFRHNPRTRGLFAESREVPYVQQQVTGRLALNYSFREVLDSLSVNIAYDVDRIDFAREPEITHDPADLEPSYPQHGWFNEFSLRLNYSNRESFPRSVTTAKGWAAYVSTALQDPVLGSDYQSITFGYGFDFFLQNPIWPRHSLGFLLDGALVVSDLTNPRRYAVGGNSPQDVFTSVLLQQQRRTFVIRGFEPNVTSGSQYQVLQVAYRFPIFDFDQGFSTAPVFLRQLKGAVFMDNGGAYDGFLADAQLLTGFGAELLLESVFAYYLIGNLRLGYARGLGPDGIHEVYALFGGGF